MDSLGPENTRARLIAAAAADIRQIGAKRMTILGLAERLGMSHANVYRFFADKTALVDAVLNTALRSLEMRLAEIVDGPDPAHDKLERFLTTWMRAYAEMSKADGAVFALFSSPSASGREAERHYKRLEDLTARIVEEGIATRLFSGSETRRSVALVLDLTYRFTDPVAVVGNAREQGASDVRRDRLIRAVIRILTGQKYS